MTRETAIRGQGTIPSIPPADVLRRLAALKTATTMDLKVEWKRMFGTDAPPFNRAYLQSRLAHRVQALAYGAIRPETRQRLEALGERLDGGNLVLRRTRADNRPVPGTRLMRSWAGTMHTITVRTDDFEFEGRPYRSLSAVARQITGTRWNGWTFFGLNERRGRV